MSDQARGPLMCLYVSVFFFVCLLLSFSEWNSLFCFSRSEANDQNESVKLILQATNDQSQRATNI